ncbi:hypothetical protein AVEN_263066-1 [Araneus ventricosus]|uniref:Uncharacterized protein n=1 Tax=Araneus ventricosus TaxID=182803 RepID=A0A4Y2MWF8_ARAVE|nr:hypothetical protein AVEN_263066-1 [Araneus ventricosus]
MTPLLHPLEQTIHVADTSRLKHCGPKCTTRLMGHHAQTTHGVQGWKDQQKEGGVGEATVKVAVLLFNKFVIKTPKKAFSDIQPENSTASNEGSEEDSDINYNRAIENLLLIPPHLRKDMMEVRWLIDGSRVLWTQATAEYLDPPRRHSPSPVTRFSAIFPSLRPEDRKKF